MLGWVSFEATFASFMFTTGLRMRLDLILSHSDLIVPAAKRAYFSSLPGSASNPQPGGQTTPGNDKNLEMIRNKDSINSTFKPRSKDKKNSP
jgi:hypothetical protein